MTYIQKLEIENRQLRAALEKIAEVTSYERVNNLRGECISKGGDRRVVYVDAIVNARVIAEDTLIMAKAMDALGEEG